MPASPDSPASDTKPDLLRNPALVLACWVAPVAALLALNVSDYFLVAPALTPPQQTLAGCFGATLLVNLGLAGWCWCSARTAPRPNRDPRSPWWSAAVLAAQVSYLWLVAAQADELLPLRATGTLLSAGRFQLHQFTFAMVPVLFAVLHLAARRPNGRTGIEALWIFAGTAVVPSIAYALLILTTSSAGHGLGAAFVALVAVALVGLALLLVYAGARGLWLLHHALNAGGVGRERGAVAAFALLLPGGGLALNHAVPFPADFQRWEIFTLASLNAVLLFAATFRGLTPAWLRVGALTATLPFSLYFFAVFLPVLPLAVPAMLALGAGVLLLAPTLLLSLHGRALFAAYREAVGALHRRAALVAGLAGFLLLPALVVGRAYLDRRALHAALDHVYTPRVAAGELRFPGNRAAVVRALTSYREQQEGVELPFLTEFYDGVVFDHLVLPEAKAAELEALFRDPAAPGDAPSIQRRNSGNFFGNGPRRPRRRTFPAVPPPQTVAVRDLQLTAPAPDRLTLELTLENFGAANQAEYVARLPLPPGAIIDGFRLDVGGRPVPGRIFERKTALWVYQTIRDHERRDPGLLVYAGGNELELRVFPVVRAAPSRVAIDFRLPTPLDSAALPALQRDPAETLRQLTARMPPAAAATGVGTLLTGAPRSPELPPVKRERFLHVIVDRSATHGFDGDLSAALRHLHDEFPDAIGVRVTAANFEVRTLLAERTAWRQLPNFEDRAWTRRVPTAGGLAADLAVAQALASHATSELVRVPAGAGPPPTPVIVFLSKATADELRPGPLTAAWRDVVPTLQVYGYANGRLRPVTNDSAGDTSLLRLGGVLRPWLPGRAVAFPAGAALADTEYWEPSCAEWRPLPFQWKSTAAPDSAWARAAELQLRAAVAARSPGDAGADLATLVQASRAAGVLVPQTSFIVVENAAQWLALQEGERRKLGQNAALEFVETPAPDFVALLAGCGAWWLARRIRRARFGTAP